MKRLIQLLFVFVLCGYSATTFAQLDKVHYIPPFYATNGANNSSDLGRQWLAISTQDTVAFEVAILRGSEVFDTITISKSSPQLLDLGTGYSNGTTSYTGIVNDDSLNTVLSDQAFTLTAENTFFTAVYQKSNAQGDVLTCKGETALGTEFYTGHVVADYGTTDSRRSLFVTVMAAFDNTTITFNNPRVKYSGQANNIVSVTLDKGESYALGISNVEAKAAAYVLNDFNGTKITSNKPIAVNSGSWCGSASTGSQRDIGIDQVVPVNFVGKEYIAVEGDGTSNGEQIIVVATKDNTELKVNGIVVATIANQGEYYIIPRSEYHAINDNMYINSNENIYVFQTLSGANSDVAVGMCFLPPLSCLSNREVNISYANAIGNPALSIITEKGSDVTINGDIIIQTPDTVAANSDWVTYRVDGTEVEDYDEDLETFEIVSSGAINAALSFESNAIGGAGYYSGFGFSPTLQSTPTVGGTEACYPNNAILEASGYDEYVWYYNGEVIPDSTAAEIIPGQTGEYRVSGRTTCGLTKASDPYLLKTCLTLEGGGTFAEDTGDVLIILRLGLVSTDDVTYWYRTQSGTAIEGADFQTTVGSGTIMAGDLFDTISLSITDDLVFESEDETFTFDVYNATNATVKNLELEFVIQDDDVMPTVIVPSTQNISENGDTLKIPLSKNGNTQDSLFFNYTTQDITAVAGTDYTSTTGLMSFAPSESFKYIYVPILDNALTSPDKTFKVTYSDLEGATLDNSSTVIKINDDEDGTTCLSLEKIDEGVDEGDTLSFRVKLAQLEGIDVDFKLIMGNTTTDASDYISLDDTTYTLKAGVIDTVFTIVTVEDSVVENDEVFSCTLVNVVNAKACADKISLSIYNDDYLPNAISDSYTMDEDDFMTANVLTNDEILGDTPVVVVFDEPNTGSLLDLGSGAFTFTPASNYFGVVSFNYHVTDSSGDTTIASINIEVQGTDDIPIAHNDTVETTEDSTLIFYPMANDEDIDGASLILDLISNETLGTVYVQDDYIVYTPLPNVHGIDTLVYDMSDFDGDIASAEIYITINPSNDMPIGHEDVYNMTEGDLTTTLDVLFNDEDPDASGLYIYDLKNVIGGSAVEVNDKVEFTLTDNFWGAASFDYILADGEADTVTVGVDITVAGVNDLPIANADSRATNEDVSVAIAVLANDVDIDDRGIRVDSMSTPPNGGVTVFSDIITYTPNPNYCGLDSFIYYIADYNGDVTSSQVSMTINCMGDDPLAVDDNYSILEDAATKRWAVLSNDGDIDNSGLTLEELFDVTSGSATIVSDSLEYTSAANFNGVASLSYVMMDGEGDKDTATVKFTISSVNDVPLALRDYGTTNEDNSIEISVLTNDIDIDNSGLTLDSVGLAYNGATSIITNKITYSPNSNYVGLDSFLYFIADDEGDVSQAMVVVTVTPINDIPVAVNDTVWVFEDSVLVISPLDNDSDPEDTLLTNIRIQSTPTLGSAVIENSNITYTPQTNIWGKDSIIYLVRDSEGIASGEATIYIDIISVNESPVLSDVSRVLDEDNADAVDVMLSSQDPDLSGLSLSKVGQAMYGVSSVLGNAVVYQPDLDFVGKDTVAYYVHDGENDTSVAYIYYNVSPINDAPVAINDTVSVFEDTSIGIALMSNDIDVEDALLNSFTLVDDPTIGTYTLTSDSIFYTPNTNLWGLDSLTYYTEDSQGLTSNLATVYITIDSINELPVLTNVSVNLEEDAGDTTDVVTTAEDIDFSGLILAKVDQGLFGTTSVLGNSVVYHPHGDYVGKDTVAYYIVDGESDTAMAYLYYEVTQLNDAPIAINDTVSVSEDTSIGVAILLNDIDLEDASLNSFTLVDDPTIGTYTLTSDSIFYTPNANLWGLDSLTYYTEDSQGLTSNIATVYITIDSVNELPILTNVNVNLEEDAGDTTDVVTTAEDIDFSGLSLAKVDQGLYGTTSVFGNSVVYHPHGDYVGKDTVAYYIVDGEGDTAMAYLYYEVTQLNDVPVAINDTVSVSEDTSIGVAILLNDIDLEDASLNMFTLVDDPTIGTYTLTSDSIFYTPNTNLWGLDSLTYYTEDSQGLTSNIATVYITIDSVNELPILTNVSVNLEEDAGDTTDVVTTAEDVDFSGLSLAKVDQGLYGTTSVLGNSVVYYPHGDYVGKDTVAYYIVDGESDTAIAYLYYEVTQVNDAPVAINDTVSVYEDTSIGVAILLNDIDLEDASLNMFTLVDDPTIGTYTLTSDSIFYTPNTNLWGLDSLTYYTEDSQGLTSNLATVYITIDSVNEAPLLLDLSVVLQEDEGDTTDVIITALDADISGLSLSKVGQGLHGVSSVLGDAVVYQPDFNFLGKDTVAYYVHDGENDTAMAYLYYNITPVNDAPIAVNDTFSVLEDTEIAIVPMLNDTDAEDSVLTQFVIVDEPSLGTYILNNDSVIYTPNTNVWGLDSFTYKVSDVYDVMSNLATVFITIDSVNEVPILTNVSVSLVEDAADTTDVIATANDIDFSGLLLAKVDQGGYGTSSVLGNSVVYHPHANYVGKDTVAYYVRDGENDTAVAYLYYDFSSVNDAPVAINDTLTVFEDNDVTIALLSNDVDVEDSMLTQFTIVDEPSLGTYILSNDSIIYSPSTNIWGVDSLTYFTEDSQGLESNLATIYLTIDSVNELPILANINISLEEDKGDTTDVLSSAQDPDFSGLSLSKVDQGLHGVSSVLGSSIVYQPDLDFLGKDTVAYYIHDGENDTAVAYLYYNITPVNDTPVAINDTVSINEDTEISIVPLFNDMDAEDSVLAKFLIVDEPSLGSYIISNDSVIYTPNTNVWGLDSFTYYVFDSYDIISNLATVYITIDSVNDIPILTNINVSLEEDEGDTTDVLSSAQDPDFSGLSLSKVEQGLHGVSSVLGSSVVYQPDLDFLGRDTVAYYVHDGENDTAMAYLYYNITPINDAPIAVNDTVSVDEDSEIAIALLINDMDAEDSVLSQFTVVDEPSLGTYMISNDSVIYTPNVDVWGVDSMSYYAEDKYGSRSNLASIYITIDSVNEAPILVDVYSMTNEDSLVSIDVMEYAQSPDASTLTLVALTEAINGEAMISEGNVLYTPTSDYYGDDSLYYVVVDGEGDSTTAMLHIEVLAINDAPICNVAPRIVGVNMIDSVISCDKGEWTDVDGRLSFSYQWVAIQDGNNTYISAHADSLVVTEMLSNSRIYCVVEATDDGYPLPALTTSAISDTLFTVAEDMTPIMDSNYPQVLNISGDSVTVAIKTDKDGLLYYVIQEVGKTIPDYDSISQDGIYFTANEEVLITGGDLIVNQSYEVIIYLTDTSGNFVSEPVVQPFTTIDDVAPSYVSQPFVQHSDIDAVTVVVEMDEATNMSYVVYEEDQTVVASGNVILDTATVKDESVYLEEAYRPYQLKIDGLRSQVHYVMEISATDTLQNSADDVILEFSTNDTVIPFFPAEPPYIKEIVDGRINYIVRSSEGAQLFVRLAEAEVSQFDEVDPLGIYDEVIDLEENISTSLQTEVLEMDGKYRLDFVLQDTAGNFSSISSYEFRYPETLGMELLVNVIYQGEELIIDNIQGVADFIIYDSYGNRYTYGTVNNDLNGINIDFLREGYYIIYLKDDWEQKSIKFMKSTTSRPGNM